MTSEFELTVTSKMENLAVVYDFVTSVAGEFSLSDDETFALQMAVDEACANVIEHAYDRTANGKMSIRCRLIDDEIVVIIRDHGRPFNPQCVPRPDVTAPLDKRCDGGLGLYLMEKLMDSIAWEFDPGEGNTLTMRKRRGKPAV